MPIIKAHPWRDHFSKWPVVLSLYDGRACPRCHAVVIGWQSRAAHAERCKQFDALDAAVRQLNETVRILAEHAGFRVRSADVGDLDDDDDGVARFEDA